MSAENQHVSVTRNQAKNRISLDRRMDRMESWCSLEPWPTTQTVATELSNKQSLKGARQLYGFIRSVSRTMPSFVKGFGSQRALTNHTQKRR